MSCFVNRTGTRIWRTWFWWGCNYRNRWMARGRIHCSSHDSSAREWTCHSEFQIRGQGLIFTPRNLCCADVLWSRISPLAGGNPKPVKQDERFCFPLLLPTHTFFHKQLFFRIIELLEADPAGIPPHPTGSMRSWDNSLSIHAEPGISQSDLESGMNMMSYM